MFCSGCGKPLTPGMAFCQYCGRPVETGAQQSGAQNVAPVAQYDPEAFQIRFDVPAVQEETVVPVKPAAPKKKKTKAILTVAAIVTAVALVLSCVAGWWFFAGPGAKETVYLLVAERHYNPGGVNYSLVEYEYDEQGRLLSKKIDRGEQTEVWNEDLGIYEYVFGEADGTTDGFMEYRYDEHGDLIRTEEKYHKDEDVRTMKYDWEYDGDVPESVQIVNGSYKSSPYYLDHDDGMLTSIYYKGDVKTYCSKAEYDEEGRLTEEILFHMEGDLRYTYEYDKDGRLVEVRFFRRNHMPAGVKERDWNRWYTTEFTYGKKGALEEIVRTDGEDQQIYHAEYGYDSKGRLISKKDDDGNEIECRYDGKHLESATYTFVQGSETGTQECRYDKNGNLIRWTDDDGGYVRYEYKKVRLSREDAAQYRRMQQRDSRIGADGLWRNYQILERLYPTPLSPEYFADPPRGRN